VQNFNFLCRNQAVHFLVENVLLCFPYFHNNNGGKTRNHEETQVENRRVGNVKPEVWPERIPALQKKVTGNESRTQFSAIIM